MAENKTTFKIEGDPGQNNTFVNIGHVENYNPNATTVNNTYYGTREGRGHSEPEKPNSSAIRSMLEKDLIDKTPIREKILNYVSCIRPYLAEKWMQSYMKFWEGLIDLDVMSIDLYDHGKQQHTNFNRDLVANIIHYLDSKGFYKKQYNSSEMTRALEGDADHPVRRALRNDPDTKYCDAIDSFLKAFKE